MSRRVPKLGTRLPTLYGRGLVDVCLYREELVKWKREVWEGESARGLTKASKMLRVNPLPGTGLRG